MKSGFYLELYGYNYDWFNSKAVWSNIRRRFNGGNGITLAIL